MVKENISLYLGKLSAENDDTTAFIVTSYSKISMKLPFMDYHLKQCLNTNIEVNNDALISICVHIYLYAPAI